MIKAPTQTIIAQCTPQGSGAIALLRISGDLAFVVADKFSKLASGKMLASVATHTVHYGHVVSEGEVVDQVMFIAMQAPRTFTGENVVEITCHNNPFIIEKIITLAIAAGARAAQKGEFSQRAFENDKIDLTQAEAINSLIHAHTEQALKKSLSQLQGSMSSWIEKIEKTLLKCLALSEASFEFIDEEMDFAPQINKELNQVLTTIDNVKASFSAQQQIREGVRVAIIGSVNAGKSSLFNSFLKQDRAIVTEIAGTTRDSIEAGIYTKQHYITLVDTAGLRQTNNRVERIGIGRSLAEAQRADIILLTFDGSRQVTKPELEVYQNIFTKNKNKVIIVVNKSDKDHKLKLPELFTSKTIQTSSTSKQGIKELEDTVMQKIDELVSNDAAPFLLNQRQFNILNSVALGISKIKKMLSRPEYELISLHLNDTLQNLSELSGKTVSEKGMDTIFKEFCVGK